MKDVYIITRNDGTEEMAVLNDAPPMPMFINSYPSRYGTAYNLIPLDCIADSRKIGEIMEGIPSAKFSIVPA